MWSTKRSEVNHGAWSCKSAATVTRVRAAMLPALTSPGGPDGGSYRLRFPHIDARADGCWLALSSPVHFLHHAVHVASREAMEKHRCRRGEDIITVLFGSATQDVHQRQQCAQIRHSKFLFKKKKKVFLSCRDKCKSRLGRKKSEEKIGHVFSTLRLICQWKPSSESLQLPILTRWLI